MGKNNKQVLRDYNSHLQRQAVKQEIKTEKPMMNVVVFICMVLIIISLLVPMVRIYVWSNELGLYPQNGLVYSVNLFDALNMVFTGGETIDISSVEDIKDSLASNNLWKIIVGENSGQFDRLIDNVILTGITGILVLALTLTLFVLSMMGIVGAKRTEPFVRWLTLALFVVTACYAVFSSMINADATPLNVLSIKITGSFGSYAAAALSLCAGIMPWVLKK